MNIIFPPKTEDEQFREYLERILIAIALVIWVGFIWGGFIIGLIIRLLRTIGVINA